MNSLLAWFRRGAESVAVGLLTAIFVLFILQIFTRYVIRQPLGWTLEACLIAWLWLVFWSAAFTLKHSDHVRFTVLSDAVGPGLRRMFILLSASCLVTAFALSLPATVDFIGFMAIERSSLLKIRFDHVFSVYLIFAVAIIVRYLFQIIDALRTTSSGKTTSPSQSE
ncbi:MAG: TRAP transporter small permease [Geminicoccaceae bacterium]